MRNLRTLRKEAKLTQEDLASRVGMTARKLGSLERGETEMTLADAVNIANALGVSVGYLAGEEERSDEIEDDRLLRILNNYKSMNETGRSRLAEQAWMMAGSGMFVDLN